MALSDLDCRHAKPQSSPYKLRDSSGLYLEVRSSGTKIWRQRYKICGKEKLLTHGNYPAVSLVQAREKRDAARADIAGGINPNQIKREQKILAKYASAQTFELVAREWLQEYKSRWADRTHDNTLSRLEKNVFPFFGKMPVSEITPPMIYACVRRIEERKTNELARRVLRAIGQVFRYAVVTGRAESDKTRDLKGALFPHRPGHFAAITIEELPELLRKLNVNTGRLYRQTTIAMWLMILTFVRTSELLEARWDEVNFDRAEWRIPPERMKMKSAHTVPLSKQAIALLRELETISRKRVESVGLSPNYLFPSFTRRDKPMSNTTLLMALRRMDYYRRMTGHGFRALAMSTIKERLGYRHEVVDRQLAHLPKGKVNQAYDRADFLGERKVMMQQWADYIDEVQREKPTVEVNNTRANSAKSGLALLG